MHCVDYLYGICKLCSSLCGQNLCCSLNCTLLINGNEHALLLHSSKRHDYVKNCMIKFRQLPKKDGKEMEMLFDQ